MNVARLLVVVVLVLAFVAVAIRARKEGEDWEDIILDIIPAGVGILVYGGFLVAIAAAFPFALVYLIYSWVMG